MQLPRLLTAGQAARLLGTSRATFYRRRRAGRAPAPCARATGAGPLWRESDLRRWQAAQAERREGLQ